MSDRLLELLMFAVVAVAFVVAVVLVVATFAGWGL